MNHPNRQRTPYTVRIGRDVAKFSNYLHAMDFAAANSYGGRLTEVGHKTGIVGQYCNGKTTPEFALHDAEYRKALEAKLSGDRI
jgi:hypothetical protein